jgi:hypothetical protein
MIQLATEATASKTSYRPMAQGAGKGSTDTQRGRAGHAWPFLSRYEARPSKQEGPKNAGTDSGS